MKRVVSSVFGLLVGLSAIGFAVPVMAQEQVHTIDTYDRDFDGNEGGQLTVFDEDGLFIQVSNQSVWLRTFDGNLFVTTRVTIADRNEPSLFSGLVQYDCGTQRYRDRGQNVYLIDGVTSSSARPLDYSWHRWESNTIYNLIGSSTCADVMAAQ